MDLLHLSAFTGLLAMMTLTGNVILGMLLSTAYKKSPLYKKLPPLIKKISVIWLHNWTAYLALALVLLHPLLLILDHHSKFKLIDVIFPVNAPHQKVFVALGTLSMLALFVVIITTQKVVKKKMSFRLWKNIHLISYGTAMLFIIHGIKMDPHLLDRPTDWLDAEKVLCELCALVLVIATVLRAKYNFEKKGKQVVR